MTLSLFWTGDKESKWLEGFSYSQEHWSVGDDVDEHRRKLLDRIEVALARKIVSTEVRAAGDRSLVLEVELEDGRREIVRVPMQLEGLGMFKSEVALLEWLGHRTLVPVPRIRCVVQQSSTEPNTFAVMEKLPGDCLMNVFGGLSYADKALVIKDMANIALQLNDLVVPQRIGTTLVQDGEVTIVPPHGNGVPIFENLENYLDFRIQVKRASSSIGSDDADRARAQVALTRLSETTDRILASLSFPVYRRCIIHHDDLGPTNVLVDGNRVSGVVDWEYHSTLPVVLAAKFPDWIRCDGVYNSRYRPDANLETRWITSREDANKLRAVYGETIRATSSEYWIALMNGQVLREIDEYLSDDRPDPGCDRMSAWLENVRSRYK